MQKLAHPNHFRELKETRIALECLNILKSGHINSSEIKMGQLPEPFCDMLNSEDQTLLKTQVEALVTEARELEREMARKKEVVNLTRKRKGIGER